MLFSGCHSLQPTEKSELTLENSEFMGLWSMYNRCAIDQDPLQMRDYVHQLTEAPRPISINQSPIPLPKFLKNLASHRGSRLSVDPRAMAASCALLAGEIAWKTGDPELARELLQAVVDGYPEAEYAYYVEKARDTMEQVPYMRNVSLE